MRGNKARIRAGLAALACCATLAAAAPATAAEGWRPRVPPSGDFVGAYAAAIDSLRTQWQEHGPGSPPTLRWMLRASELLRLSGRHDEAGRMLRRSTTVAHALPSSAPALELELCIQEMRLGRHLERGHEQVEAAWERGRKLLQQHPELPARLQADLLQARANQLRANGDRATALALYAEALSWRRTGSAADLEGLADNLTWLSWLRLAEGELVAAREGLREARGLLDRAGHDEHPLRCTIEGNLARLDELGGRVDEAIPVLARTVEFCDFARRGLPAGAPRRGYLVADDRVRLALLRVLQDRADEAWPLILEGFGPEATLPRAIATARATDGCTPAPPISSSGGTLRARELEDLRGDARWQRCVQEAAGGLARPVQLDEVQRQLGPATAMVAWIDLPASLPPVAGSRAWAMLITHEGPVRWLPLESPPDPIDRDLMARCRRRFRGASEWPFRVGEDHELDEDLRELGRRWLDPVLEVIPGVERLVLLPPSGRLGVEPWRGPSGEALAGQLELVHVLSPRTYASPPPPPDRMPPEVLVVAPGDDLPAIAPELAALSNYFPGLILLHGEEASSDRIFSYTGEGTAFGLVHIAGHASASTQQPGSSWISLADRRLLAAELPLRWRATTGLVVLSACRTARGPSTGAGYVGFADHFLAAGAQAVLLNRWPVPDEAASLFMQQFYRSWRGEGRSKADAVRRARLALRDARDARGERPWAHPVYWAGYLLVEGVPGRHGGDWPPVRRNGGD